MTLPPLPEPPATSPQNEREALFWVAASALKYRMCVTTYELRADEQEAAAELDLALETLRGFRP